MAKKVQFFKSISTWYSWLKPPDVDHHFSYFLPLLWKELQMVTVYSA